MTSYDTTHLERQLSSLFRAEAQDAHLPLGTWQQIAPKMGEPDRRSLFGLIRDAMRIPRAEKMWRNPMKVRYVAPAATVVLAIIIALLFILLVNDTDDDNTPTPAGTPTVPVGPTEPIGTPTLVPTFTPLPATATPVPTASATATVDPAIPLVPLDEFWSQAAPLNIARSGHQAVILDDGRVLVAGGRNADGFVAQAEVYDPTTNSWSMTGDMVTPRWEFALTILNDGRAVAIGGSGTIQDLASVEAFDPTTMQWEELAALNIGRQLPGAAVLLDGRVVVFGGLANTIAIDASEVYDPSSDSWQTAGSLALPRTGGTHTSTVTDEGLVVVAGTGWRDITGRNSVPVSSVAEVFDPATLEWAAIGSLPDTVENGAVFTTPSGQVAFIGTTEPAGIPIFVTLDPESLSWIQGSEPLESWYGPSVVSIGADIVVGLDGERKLERLDSSTNRWEEISSEYPEALEHPSAAVSLGNGRALFVGGRFNPVQWSDSAYILELPEGGSSVATPTPEVQTGPEVGPAVPPMFVTDSMANARFYHSVATLEDGRVLVAGGAATVGDFSGDQRLDSAEVFDPTTETWSTAGSLNEARESFGMVRLEDGRVLAAGGFGESGQALTSAEIFNPLSNSWAETASMNTARVDPGIVLLADGRVLVYGGLNSDGGRLASAEVFDANSEEWSVVQSMAVGRSGGANLTLPDGRVLVAGVGRSHHDLELYTVSQGTDVVEAFDPVTNTWSPVGSMTFPVGAGELELLPGGEAIFYGTGLGFPHILDIATETWTEIDPATMEFSRWSANSGADPQFVRLPDGRLLFGLGSAQAQFDDPFIFGFSIDMWDHDQRAISKVADFPVDLYYRRPPTMTPMGDGRILITGGGGFTSGPSAATFILDPSQL